MKRLLTLSAAALIASAIAIDAQPNSDRQVPVPLSKGWKRVTSGDVVAMGDVSEKALRERLEEIATFRAAFQKLHPEMRVALPVGYRVVVFPDAAALHRYAPRDARGRPLQYVGGYFSIGPDINIMALGGSASQLVFHEMAHAFLSRNLHSLPEWLNEGLAELYSSFETDWKKGRSLIGRAPAERAAALARLQFVPLKDIVFATPAEMEKFWNRGERIGMFYAEAWALVHYLEIGRTQNTPGAFGTFVTLVERGTPVDRAIRESFDASVEQLDGELRGYLRRSTLPAVFFPVARTDDRDVSVERMTEADVRYIQGDLLARVGDVEEAEKELSKALAMDPTHVDARIALARVRVAQDRASEGVDMLQPIVQSAPDHFAAIYALATALLAMNRQTDAIEMYSRCTKLLDASPDAWYGLSLTALALGRIPQANAAMQQVQQRRSDPAWYRRRAYDALRLGLDAQAATDARKYLTEAGWSADTVYTAFVAVIAHQRLKQQAEASEMLEHARNTANVPEWTLAVIDYLEDRLSPDAFLAKAGSDGEKTEAHTYIAFKFVSMGRDEEAMGHLKWVRDHGSRNYVEFGMANGELKRLQSPRVEPAR